MSSVERERVTNAERSRAGRGRHAISTDPAAERRGPGQGDFANLERHHRGDGDQPPGRVTASFLAFDERPLHERRAEWNRSRLFGRELALQLVDEVIDRPAIEPLSAFTPLIKVKDRQPRALEKRAAPGGDLIEREAAAVVGEQFLEPADLVVTGQIRPAGRPS